MSKYELLRSYVPLYYHSSKVFDGILGVEGIELDLLTQEIIDLSDQCFVDTASWGLSRWERELGLGSNTNLSIEARRSIIKGKLRGSGKVDAVLIKTVAEAYSNGEVDVAFDGDIVITFIGKRGRPAQMEMIQKQVYDIIPAHLQARFVMTYMSWDEFDQLSAVLQESMTWDQLEAFRL